MPDGLQQALDLLTSRPQSVEELHAQLPPGRGITATNNQLVDLEELGLARRTGKRGKAVLWVVRK